MRTPALLLAAALLLTACTGGDPEPAPTAQAAPGSYLALGDSVAAGVGAEEPGTGGYVPLLREALVEQAGPLRLTDLAVSGATTASLLRDQLPQAREVLQGEDVRLVTLTVGGNDVFLPVLQACAVDPASAGCRTAVAASVRTAGEGVARALAGLREVDPDVVLAVMTYYDPLPGCRLAALSPLSRRVLEGDAARPGLNDALRTAAATQGAVVVETADLLRAPEDLVGGDDCLHPSGSGHARIAEAFAEAVGDEVAGDVVPAG